MSTTPIAEPPRGQPVLISKERYTSRAFLEREMERVWSRTWQMACREEEVPEVGSFCEYVIGDQSILVVRAAEDRIKAYFNACLHRGTALKQGRGAACELRCPFHGWAWNLDGSSKQVIDRHDFTGIDSAYLCLPECRVGTWGGFVFVNPDPDAEPLNEYLAPVIPMLAPYHLDRMRIMSWTSTTVPCNWKVAVEAFIESYHVSQTHPEGRVACDDPKAVYERFGIHGRMRCPNGRPCSRFEYADEAAWLRDAIDNMLRIQYVLPHQLKYLRRLRNGEEKLPSDKTLRDVMIEFNKERAALHGWDAGGLDDDQFIDQHEFLVFPSLVIGLMAGEFFGFRVRPTGEGPDSCLFEIISLRFPLPDYRPPNGPRYIEWSEDPEEQRRNFGNIIYQDFSNLPRVQVGLHSRRLAHVRFADYQELLCRHLHDVIDRYLEHAAG